MSRCFSFPPPNYELSDERIGIMMELIELKEEKEKRREERRERREKKEEKRRERRERAKVQNIELESKVERRDGKNSNKRKRENCFTSQESSSSSSRCLPDAIVHGLELLQCKDLLEKLLLPPEVEDSDWLTPNTNTSRRSEEMKRQRCGSDTLSCSRASTPWPPRAQYLHQIDAYALPYILPF